MLDTIFRRRSVRSFAPDPVPEQALMEIIRAGMHAPSAGNERPWHFIVMTERATLDRIPEVHPHARMLREARAAVLVCFDPDREKHKGYWPQDLSACVENMLLAAVELGYGSVWLGVYPREDRVRGLRSLLGIPETVVPFALLPFGRPAETKKPEDRFEQDRIRRERW